MSISTLPERTESQNIAPGGAARIAPSGLPRFACVGLSPRAAAFFFAGLLLLVTLPFAPPAAAQASKAQRAIENLENCSEQERKSGCVAILKVERGDGDRQSIKAQVRGRRIIWYEYDRKSGRVRRTN